MNISFAFTKVMDDDFQTQNGITIVYEMIRELNRMLEEPEVSKETLEMMLNDLIEILAIFGYRKSTNGRRFVR
jgi:Cysteinyl-tRNA synthetase